MTTIDGMLKKAKEIIRNSYSPYSHIKVASVVETEDGSIYIGVNVENASYGLTICAERVAIFNAITHGKRKFRRILIYSPDVLPYPCGACRQVMAEFFEGDEDVIIATNENIEIKKFRELLPYMFKINE